MPMTWVKGVAEREVHPRWLKQHRGDEPSATNHRLMQGALSWSGGASVGTGIAQAMDGYRPSYGRVSPKLWHERIRGREPSSAPERLTASRPDGSKGRLVGSANDTVSPQK
jgi:hypothetical protein